MIKVQVKPECNHPWCRANSVGGMFCLAVTLDRVFNHPEEIVSDLEVMVGQVLGVNPRKPLGRRLVARALRAF